MLISLWPPVSPQVSATFAASLVTSPAIGDFLSARYGDSLVVLVATVIAVADIAFVFFIVPESLPDKVRLTSWGFPISWEQADPFAVSAHYSVTSQVTWFSRSAVVFELVRLINIKICDLCLEGLDPLCVHQMSAGRLTDSLIR